MDTWLTHLKAAAVIERVTTNSVLNPLLWLCGIIALTAIPAALLSKDGVQVFFCILAFLPVAAAIIAYFYFMFKAPVRLQSEEYQLENQRLLQGSKEENVFPTSRRATAHPSPQLQEAEIIAPDDPQIPMISRQSSNADNGGSDA